MVSGRQRCRSCGCCPSEIPSDGITLLHYLMRTRRQSKSRTSTRRRMSRCRQHAVRVVTQWVDIEAKERCVTYALRSSHSVPSATFSGARHTPSLHILASWHCELAGQTTPAHGSEDGQVAAAASTTAVMPLAASRSEQPLYGRDNHSV